MTREWGITFEAVDGKGNIVHSEAIKSRAARFSVFACQAQRQIAAAFKPGMVRAVMRHADGSVHAVFEFRNGFPMVVS